MGARDIVVLGFFLASAPVCFFRPFYGALLWVVVAFLNPHRFAWNAAQNFPLALLIAIPTVIGMVLFASDWRSLKTREMMLIGALMVWFTLTSFAAAGNPVFVHHIADTWEKWEFVTKILLMTGVTVALLNSFARLRIMVLVIAGCFGLLVLKAFPFILMTGGAFRLFGPEQSMIGDNNDFGLALNMTLPLFFCLAQSEPTPWVRKLFEEGQKSRYGQQGARHAYASGRVCEPGQFASSCGKACGSTISWAAWAVIKPTGARKPSTASE